MPVTVSQEPLETLAEYARISIAFEVHEVFDVFPDGGGDNSFRLASRPVAVPYLKDYDAIHRETPAQWPQRFDMSAWGLFAARLDDQCVGGAAVACNTPGLDMLEGRSDLAVLWDIRVVPGMRSQGVGHMLFEAAAAWALARGCRQLKIETQNINVAACRFYARQGCALRAAHRDAYFRFPGEIQLLWYKGLA